jgi:hypothetical protein
MRDPYTEGLVIPGDELANQAARMDDLDAPLTAEEEATLKRREGVENALLNAEEVAEVQGFPDLAKVLARVSLFWDLGVEDKLVEYLDKLRERILRDAKLADPVDSGTGEE